MIRIEINQQQLAGVQLALLGIKNGTPRALSRALNTTANKAKTRAGRVIREQVILPASYVNDALTVERATFSRLSARVKTPYKGMLLSRFVHGAIAPMVTGDAPVRTRVKPGGRIVNWPGGFIITLKNSGYFAIATRRKKLPKVGPRGGDGQLQVEHGPSLSQVYNTKKAEISAESGDVLAQELDREAAAVLRQYG